MAFRGLLAALVMAAAALYSTDAWALDRYWVGGSSNSWMDPLNWSLGQPTGGPTGIPTGNDRAVINSGTPTIVSGTGVPIASEVLIDYLFMGAAGTLTIQDGMSLIIRSDGASWTSPFGFNSYVEGTGTISTPLNGGGPGFGTGQILIRNGTNGILFNQSITTGNIRLEYTNGKPNISNPSQALRISSNITIIVNGHLNMVLGAIQLGTNPNSGGVVLDVRGDIRIGDPVDPLSASFLYLKAAGTTIKCGGNWLQGGGKLKDTTGQSTTIFNGLGTTPQTIQVNNADLGSCEFDTLIIASGSRTVTYMNNPSLAPGFTVTVSLILNNNVTFKLQDGVIAIGSILFQDGGVGSNAVLRLEGAVANLATTLSAGIGTVEYAGVGISQTVRATAGPYYNLTIDNSGGVGVQATQENAALTVQRDLLIGKTLAAGTSVARFTGAAQNITVGNDLTVNGTFTHGNSTVIMRTTFDGAAEIRSDLTPPIIPLTFNAVTVSGAVVPAPTGTMVASLQNVAGNVTTGTHSYTATFVDANNFESAMSPPSNIVSTDAANGRVDLSTIPVGPTSIVKRRIYRTVAGNGGAPQFLTEIPDNVTTTYVDNTADSSLGAIGIFKVQPATAPTATLQAGSGVTAGTHSYAVTFVDANGVESGPGPSSNTVTTTAPNGQVGLTNIPVAPGTYTKRVYRTLQGTGNLRFLTALAGATTIFTDNVADTGLGAAPPAPPQAPATAPTVALLAAPGNVTAGTHTYRVTFVNSNFVESAPGPSSAIVTTTAANPRVSLTAIPIGPAGVIERRIYRTVAGNAAPAQFVAEISDNITTTYTDNTADGSLGADGPITPVPPTAAPTTATLAAAGNVNPGLHSWYVTFVSTAGVESAPGPGSDPLNVPAARQINVTNIPIGPVGIARRRIYRKVAGNTGSPLFLREIPDNTATTTGVDNTADAGLGVAAPPAGPSGSLLAVVVVGANGVDVGTHSYFVTFVDVTNLEGPAGAASTIVNVTAGNGTVLLYNIPLGPAGGGIVRRRLYRTVAGNTGSPRLLVEIADNTTTDFKDTTADSGLGAPAPTTFPITVVTAARNFAVANAFTVPRGKLTLASGVAVDGQLGLTVGDNLLPGGASQDATLELIGNVTLRIGAGRTLLVQPNDGMFVAGNLTSAAPTVTNVGDSGALGRFLTSVQGIVDITRLEFRCADAAGLNINTTAAKVKNLRNVAFRNINPVSGSRHLTINAPNLDMDCPGCYFDTIPVLAPAAFNVQAIGANTNMRLRFEDRRSSGSTVERGPGAGETSDKDDDANDNGVIDGAETALGSIVQWVYTANVDMTGAIQGFPTPAFDWFTAQYYSTYVVMRNSSGVADSIYVLDLSGDLKSYSFTLPIGDIIGPLFWTTESGLHYVYFGTSDGKVYRLIDDGSSLVPSGQILGGGNWSSPYTAGDLLAVTSPVISDGVNLYFAGQSSSSPTYALYEIEIFSKSSPNPRISTANIQVTTGFAWWDLPATRYVFGASRAAGGTSYIGRAETTNWTVTGVYAGGSSDFMGNVNITNTLTDATFYLYAGEANGTMHAVKALGTLGEFSTVKRPGYPFKDKSFAIRTGAILDFPTGRVFFGNDAGDLYTLKPFNVAWVQNGTFFCQTTPDGSPLRGMLLFESGVLYGANSTGKVYAVDVNNINGLQTLFMTFNLGTMALSDISRDFWTGRLYVASANGRLHSFETVADPSPGNP